MIIDHPLAKAGQEFITYILLMYTLLTVTGRCKFRNKRADIMEIEALAIFVMSILYIEMQIVYNGHAVKFIYKFVANGSYVLYYLSIRIIKGR